MCTYNRNILMLRSIKCILDQTFKDLELLIINDGSTDNTEEVLIQLEKQDSRIRHITKEHDFISTRTRAFKEAKGEYIALLDSDDLCPPNKIEEQVKFLDNNLEVDLVSTKIRFGNSDNELLYPLENLNHQQIINYLKEGQELSNITHFPSIMFRKKCLDIFKDNIFYPEFYQGGEDQAFLYTLLWKGYKFANINSTLYLYNYNVYEDSISSTVGKHFSDTYLFTNFFGKPLNEKFEIIEKLYNKYNN